MAPSWWAKGLLFENCNCQVVCPGHMHFEQLCTHERCLGYWGIRFDEGAFGAIDLAGVRAIKAYDSPQRMIDGGWTEALVIDAASDAARGAAERILTGGAGGPWAKLATFVARRLDTEHRAIVFDESGSTRRATIEGVLESEITDIRGRERDTPVTFHNIYNQVHAAEQVIARGSSHLTLGPIVVHTRGTHGLHSRFQWQGGVPDRE